MSKPSQKKQIDPKANKILAEIYITYKWLDRINHVTSHDGVNAMIKLQNRIETLTNKLRCLSTNTTLSSYNEQQFNK